MANASSESSLAQEHFGKVLIFDQVRQQPLDRDDARKAARAVQPSEVNRRHAAGGELFEQRIATDPRRRSATRNRAVRVTDRAFLASRFTLRGRPRALLVPTLLG